MPQYPNQRSAELTIELAEILVAELHRRVAGWEHAYIRFDASDQHSGLRGSYITSAGVFLFDVFEFKELFNKIRSLGVELRDEMSKDGERFCLFLLHVDSKLSFNFDYEWDDSTRWSISKMNGGSGLPVGVANPAGA